MKKIETCYWLASRLVGQLVGVNQVKECKAKLQAGKYESTERK